VQQAQRFGAMADKCSVYNFVVNQNWFSASTFVVKIATFAKRGNISRYTFELAVKNLPLQKMR
jgi:hypothetical protein